MKFSPQIRFKLPCRLLTILTILPLNFWMLPLEKTEITEGCQVDILPVGKLNGPQNRTYGQNIQTLGQENKISLLKNGTQGVFSLKLHREYPAKWPLWLNLSLLRASSLLDQS